MKTAFLPALALALLTGRANAADAPSYTKDVRPFLKTYCLECHGGKETKKGINVDSMASMLKARSFLVPGAPEKSRMYLSMTGGGKQMPPKKFGKFPTKDELVMIKVWIADGAKDDTEEKKTPEEKKRPTESKAEPAVAAVPRRLPRRPLTRG